MSSRKLTAWKEHGCLSKMKDTTRYHRSLSAMSVHCTRLWLVKLYVNETSCSSTRPVRYIMLPQQVA